MFVSLNINNMVLCKEVIFKCCMHNKLLRATTTHMGNANKIQGRKIATTKPSLVNICPSVAVFSLCFTWCLVDDIVLFKPSKALKKHFHICLEVLLMCWQAFSTWLSSMKVQKQGVPSLKSFKKPDPVGDANTCPIYLERIELLQQKCDWTGL